MKRIGVLLLAVAVLAAVLPLGGVAVAAEESVSGKFVYTITDGEATLVRYDDENVYPIEPKPIRIPDTLGGCPVTAIGPRAFYGFNEMSTITIPDSVTEIGDAAFSGCTYLETINFGKELITIGAEAFSGCFKLQAMIIPDGVTSIGDGAFSSCYNLTTITIPETVVSIGKNAFERTDSIQAFVVAENNSRYCSVDGSLFNKEKTSLIRYAVTKTDASYTIPDGVTTIEGYAFSVCDGLTSVVIPNSVTTIGECAFYHCGNLTSLDIPEGVISIGERAFFDCGNLKQVSIPSTTTEIGYLAFMWCKCYFAVSPGNNAYCSEDGVLFSKNKKILIQHHKQGEAYRIPDGVTVIEASAFSLSRDLKSVFIPDSVREIGNDAFRECGSLSSVVLPPNVHTVGEYAFYWCWSLKTLAISAGPITIGDYAIYMCDKLQTIYFAGSEQEWTNLQVGEEHNYNLTRATWKYNAFIHQGHVYEEAYDKVCGACGEQRDNITVVESFAGNSVHEEVNGLAFRFRVRAKNVRVHTDRTADLSEATMGEYHLVRMGALVTNENVTELDYEHFPRRMLDIRAKYLCNVDDEGAAFAVRIVDIPDEWKDEVVTARPYYIYRDSDGNTYIHYGEMQTAHYNGVAA